MFGKLILIMVGLITLMFGCRTYQSARRFQKTALTATGQIVEYVTKERVNKGRRSVTYAPIAEFKVAEAAYRTPSTVSSSSRPYNIGDTVEVLYDPKNPHKCRINTIGQVMGLPYALLGFGSVLTLVGLFGRPQRRRRPRLRW